MKQIEVNVDRYKGKERNYRMHSPMHVLVDEMRIYFNETAKKGVGSFGFYLGFIKRLGLPIAKRLFAETKESNVETPVKIFWWKVKQEFNKRKTS